MSVIVRSRVEARELSCVPARLRFQVRIAAGAVALSLLLARVAVHS